MCSLLRGRPSFLASSQLSPALGGGRLAQVFLVRCEPVSLRKLGLQGPKLEGRVEWNPQKRWNWKAVPNVRQSEHLHIKSQTVHNVPTWLPIGGLRVYMDGL